MQNQSFCCLDSTDPIHIGFESAETNSKLAELRMGGEDFQTECKELTGESRGHSKDEDQKLLRISSV